MKQRSLFDLEDAQPSEAAPKAMEMPLPKMVRGSGGQSISQTMTR